MNKQEWRSLRAKIIKRDKKTCQRCLYEATRVRELSVHHIIPRADGGSNTKSNLITLCHGCHDFVEVEGLNSKAAIIGSYEHTFDDDPAIVTITKEEQLKRNRDDDRPSWHRKVYGIGGK